MNKILIFLQIIACAYAVTDCSFGGNQGYFDQIKETIQCLDPDKKYCCATETGKFVCCDLANFVLTGALLILPIVAIFLVISFIISCICCFCCPFCCIYKRRNGRVFI